MDLKKPPVEKMVSYLPNKIVDCLISTNQLSLGELRFILCILSATYSGSSQSVSLSTAQLSEKIGLTKGSVHRVRKKLRQKNIIIVFGTPQKECYSYSVEENILLWKISPKKDNKLSYLYN